jgi:hypothetical protein
VKDPAGTTGGDGGAGDVGAGGGEVIVRGGTETDAGTDTAADALALPLPLPVTQKVLGADGEVLSMSSCSDITDDTSIVSPENWDDVVWGAEPATNIRRAL